MTQLLNNRRNALFFAASLALAGGAVAPHSVQANEVVKSFTGDVAFQPAFFSHILALTDVLNQGSCAGGAGAIRCTGGG